jgi:hypothetical protein
MLTAYIAGKYTDHRGPWFTRQHILAAEQIAAKLWGYGIAALCPHKNTEMLDGIATYDVFLHGCLLFVQRSHMVVLIPNWIDSNGARVERNHALESGVPIFHWEHDERLLKQVGQDDLFLRTAIEMSFEKLNPEKCRDQANCGGSLRYPPQALHLGKAPHPAE